MNIIVLLGALLLQQAAPFQLTQQVKTDTIHEMIHQMNDLYIDMDAAKKIESKMEDWIKADECASINDPVKFAMRVNEILKEQVTDAHLRFRYSEQKLPERRSAREPSKDELKRYQDETRFVNANFERIERLRGNVGYIKFNGFAPPQDMARPVVAAMEFLANADAMIIDLRTNGGGDPEGVKLFCSHFFGAKPVLLNTIEFRNKDKITKTEFWTLAKVDGPRFPDLPVYVLTSKRTGSGAEECAYNFQQLKRGTIIGEPTWGGANPGGMVRLGDHFACFIPSGRAVNPYSHTNWEGVGVQPDVKADPATSLKLTHTAAIRYLIDHASDPEHKADLTSILNDIEHDADQRELPTKGK